jgi:hypothetical protein
MNRLAAMALQDTVAPDDTDFPAWRGRVFDEARARAVGELPEIGDHVVDIGTCHVIGTGGKRHTGRGRRFSSANGRCVDPASTHSSCPITILAGAQTGANVTIYKDGIRCSDTRQA